MGLIRWGGGGGVLVVWSTTKANKYGNYEMNYQTWKTELHIQPYKGLKLLKDLRERVVLLTNHISNKVLTTTPYLFM